MIEVRFTSEDMETVTMQRVGSEAKMVMQLHRFDSPDEQAAIADAAKRLRDDIDAQILGMYRERDV